MTKKDYELVARTIREQRDISLANYERVTPLAIEDLANELANAFENDNPRFNKDVFMKACGVSNG